MKSEATGQREAQNAPLPFEDQKSKHNKKEDKSSAKPIATIGSPVSYGADSLIQRGDYWEISYEGRSSLLEDTRGLRYLALLVREAGKGPIHASELVALASQNALAVVELESKDPVMDSVAENRLIKRLEEIGFERNTATAQNNYEKVAELDEELDRIAEELRQIRVPNGRRASFATSAEKARKAVSKAISESITKMTAYPALEDLGRHFAHAIQKGQWLSYNGEVRWHVEFHVPQPNRKNPATPKVAAARAATSK